MYEGSFHEPPTANRSDDAGSAPPTHSRTLPAMSEQPKGLRPSGIAPTACGPRIPKFARRWMVFTSLPQGKTVPLSPMAAPHHWSKLGRTFPAHRA